MEDDTGYKEWLKAMYQKKAEKERILLDLFHKDNARIELEIKSKGEIPSWYSCQRCGLEFCSDKELIITVEVEPICKICSGGIKGDVDGDTKAIAS